MASTLRALMRVRQAGARLLPGRSLHLGAGRFQEETPAPPPQVDERPFWKKAMLPTTVLAMGAIGLSKELIILNEELLIVFTFSATTYLLYTKAGGLAAKYLDERSDKIRGELEENFVNQTEELKSKIDSLKGELTLSDDMKALFDYQNYQAERYHAALPNKMQRLTNEMINRRLGFLAEAEAKSLSKLHKEVVDESVEFVKEEFSKASPESKTKLLQGAISMLRDPSKPLASDPVRDAYARYFEKKKGELEARQGKELVLSEEQKKEWQNGLDDLIRRDPELADLGCTVPDKIKLN